MDIETAKTLIEMLNQSGEGVKDVFVWWMAFKYGSDFLFYSVGMGMIFWVVKTAFRVIKNQIAGEKLLEATGSHYSVWTDDQLEKACDALRKYYY